MPYIAALVVALLATLPATAAQPVLQPVGEVFFLRADADGKLGRSPRPLCAWVTSGEGTSPPMVRLPPCGVSPGFPLGERLFFTSYLPGDRTRFWITDGTVEGTELLAAFSGPQRRVEQLTAVDTAAGPRLAFTLNDLDLGVEPWVTDGTPRGTRPLADLAPGPESSSPSHLVAVGETDQELVFLLGADATPSRPREAPVEIWRSDLTPGGTRQVGILPISSQDPKWIPEPTALGDGALVWLPSGLPCDPCRSDLWRFGVPGEAPRKLLTSGPPRQHSSLPRFLSRAGSHVYFSYYDDQGDAQTWRSDGVDAEEVRTPAGQSLTMFAPVFVALGDSVVALLHSPATGRELWRIGPQEPVAHLLLDRCPGPCAGAFDLQGKPLSGPGGRHWAVFSSGRGLLATDGTPAGTRPVSGICPPAGCDLSPDFLAGDDQGRMLLARSEFTADGSLFQNLYVADLASGQATLLAQFFDDFVGAGDSVAADGLFYFHQEKGAAGFSLWRSDGTAAGTRQILDLSEMPGPVTEPPAVPRIGDAFGGGEDYWVTWYDSDDGGVAERIVVEMRSPTTTGWTEVAVVESARYGSQSYRFELAPGEVASFRVRARNQAGTSAPSEEVSLRAPTYDWRQEPCDPSTALCLGAGRFSLLVDFHNPHDGGPASGAGNPIPLPGSERTGLFSFFADDNVELVTKVLDGYRTNGHLWIFSGALTDVEYWLTLVDHESGESTTYRKPPGSVCGLTDTVVDLTPFEFDPHFPFLQAASSPSQSPLPGPATAGAEAGGDGCVPDATTLCLLGGRYAVTVEWQDQHNDRSGTGGALPHADRSGFFWFFRPDNVELVVKVLDGTPVNGKTWVFYGALTDVGYTLIVTDTESGEERTYVNQPGNICGGADTAAF